MPYPDTLPMPQTSTVTKGERRALSNEQQPREASPLQLDGMEFEELSWPPLDSSQMATLLGWWRTELLYGGAWFTATWPLPRGTVEAVRKFISPLRREFVPAANGGRWRVTVTCEVRGEGVFPIVDDGGPVVLFLDLFDGSEGTPLSDHIQDIRFNESMWSFYGEYYLPVLSGTGSAGKFGEDPPIFGPMGAQTTFGITDPETFQTTYPALKPGWILDAVITPLQSVGGDPGTQAYSEIRVESFSAYVLIRFIPESPSDSAALIFDIYGAPDIVTYPLPGGTSTLSVLLEADGATLTINGVAQDKTFSEIGAAGMPFVLQKLYFILGVETGGEEPRPTSSIQTVRISGELDETATIVTANTQTVDVAGLIHGSAYVAAYPSAGLWGDHAGMFDDQGSKADVSFTDEGLQATIAGPATSTATLASSSVDLDIGVLVAEYIIDHFDPAISYLAFGSYSDFGPGANVEEFFGGKEGVCAYLRNDGTASQYGGTATGPTFNQGDVIALIFDNEDGDGALHVWKNGVYIGVPLRLADNTTAKAVVSVTPKV